MIKNHAKQHGRSMLEMLGVLAIIGVLSITALVGFTYAMNKHRANETIYDVMLRGTNVPMIDENYYSKPSGYEFLFPGLGQNSGRQGVYYPMSTKKDSGRSYYVEATGVSYRVCELILKMEPTDIDQIVVNNSVYQGDSDICGDSDGLAMRFCFGSDGTICNGTGTGGGTSSGDTGSGGDSSSGSGSESGSDSGSSCNPACNSCSVCVDGQCEVSPCPIPSCPEGQQSTGTDSCGCIIGCTDICPGLECNGSCQIANYETCSCDIKPNCCPDFDGCSSCQTIQYNEDGCPIGCQDVDNYEECYCSGSDNSYCCMNPNEESCIPYCAQCDGCCVADPCPEDQNTDPVCCALLTDGGFWGEGTCCLSSSDSSSCCSAKKGEWCNGDTCCEEGTSCANGVCCATPIVEDCPDPCTYMDVDENGCPACIPVDCPEGQTCNPDTGTCEGKCPEDEPIFCSIGEDSWCCAEGNACGSTVGQCCAEGVCCENGQKAYRYEGSVKCCNQDPNTAPGHLCCTGRTESGMLAKAFEYRRGLIPETGDPSTIGKVFGCCFNSNPDIISAYGPGHKQYGICCGSASEPYAAILAKSDLLRRMSYGCFSCPSPSVISGSPDQGDGTVQYGCP